MFRTVLKYISIYTSYDCEKFDLNSNPKVFLFSLLDKQSYTFVKIPNVLNMIDTQSCI